MEKIDARKRTTEVQQYIREQAIRLHLSGKNRETIAEIVGGASTKKQQGQRNINV